MRLVVALALIGGALLLQRIRRFDTCELVGHDSYWPTTSLRACHRCPQTWP